MLSFAWVTITKSEADALRAQLSNLNTGYSAAASSRIDSQEAQAKAAFKEAAASLQRAIIARDLAACVCLSRGGGPSSNAETTGGITALGACVLQQARDACSSLQKEGIDLDYPARATGLSALALACKRGDPVMVHHLLGADSASSSNLNFM